MALLASAAPHAFRAGVAALLLLSASRSPATDILWGGTFATNNQPLGYLNAAGGPMTQDFLLELGVFVAGFDPAVQPPSAWAAAWRPAARTYLSVVRSGANLLYRGGSRHANPDNTAPFTIGARGYIWVRNQKAVGAEWALVTAPAWTWPEGGGFSGPLEVVWQFTSPGAVAIAGSVNGGGAQVRTAALAGVAPPVLTWAEWQGIYLAAPSIPAAQRLPEADFDGDGQSNLLEFALGSVPVDAAMRGPVPVPWVLDEAGLRWPALTIPRNASATLTWTVESATGLAGWVSGPAHTLTLSSAPDALTVRSTEALAPAAPRRQLRLKVSLP